jgi:hypothetical protein
MMVIATTTILFVLASALMFMVAYQTQATTLRTSLLQATHVADAGINAYLYQERRAYGYYLTTPDTGLVAIASGASYRVTAQPPANGQPLTLYSTGSAGDGTVTIAATIRLPTFADYMFLSNADLNIGSAAMINGQVRCNSDIVNAGHITGKVIAAGSVTNTGKMDQGYAEGQAPAPFSTVGADMYTIMLSCKGNNSYFAASGAYGYYVTVNGQTVTVAKVTGGTTTGNLTTTPVRTLTVPSSGAIYFSDNVWVQGTYSVPLTIVSDYDIYIPNNYGPANLNSTVTGGLIAQSDIIVPCWYASVPQQMTLTAALLAETGRVTADMQMGVFRNQITITGSETYFDANGGFVTVDGNGNALAGFRSRTYTYDQRLDNYPPPKYPVIEDGSLKVATWIEDKTAAQ